MFKKTRLWLQYYECINIIKLFILPQRTSDFTFICNWANVRSFVGMGHILYTKSTLLYLQVMHHLPNSHPWLYELLQIKNCFQSGIVICFGPDYGHQALLKSIKSWGGLTKERGMAEEIRLIWVYSIPQCALFKTRWSWLLEWSKKTREHGTWENQKNKKF